MTGDGDRIDLEAELYAPRRRSPAIGERPAATPAMLERHAEALAELAAELAAANELEASRRRLRVVS